MRIYVPATLDALDDEVVRSGRLPVFTGQVHAVSRKAMANLDPANRDAEEESEFDALLAAADDSLMRIVDRPAVPWQRLVVTVDVPDEAVLDESLDRLVAGDGSDVPDTAVMVVEEVPAAKIVCVHVDEPEVAALVQDVLTGSTSAMEALVDADLLWYDATELVDVPGRIVP